MKKIFVFLCSLSLSTLLSCSNENLSGQESITETIFFIVAANGDLYKEGEMKATAMLHSLPRDKELFLLKETSIDEGCVLAES
ncbi:hypothetical protein [Prevotella aurantiaca]|uniref:hypothetical protein n=1 Tax=Prevotella aurantiaca TaxID=596085 RepID=UPI00288C1DBF|nr:hypothetical protein [Prevotella aurantiaca]